MKEITYTEAMKRLEEITSAIEQGTLDIDALSDKLKEAQALLKQCKAKLQQVEKEVTQILNDDEQE